MCHAREGLYTDLHNIHREKHYISQDENEEIFHIYTHIYAHTSRVRERKKTTTARNIKKKVRGGALVK